MLEDRYGEFASASSGPCDFELDVKLVPDGPVSDAEDVSVRREAGRWVMERGDFRAEWDAEQRRGWVRQSLNPYGIDAVLRILHTLLLAREGGFLVHAASAIRNGRAYLFAGVSGAGKTTISRLAPPDVKLLTDEISYVRKVASPGFGVRGPGSGYGTRDMGYGKTGVPDAGFGVRGPESEGRSEESGVRRQEANGGSQEPGARSQEAEANLKSQISNFESRTPNPESRTPTTNLSNSESLTPNPESRVLNPKSKIENPKSVIPYPVSRTPGFWAFGTPFAGELARIGENLRAPVGALYLLRQGPQNQIEAVSDAEAAQALLRNILFFAHDAELVRLVFQSVLDFVSQVPVRRLTFVPDARVWKKIGAGDLKAGIRD
jgi:hypothetical protein